MIKCTSTMKYFSRIIPNSLSQTVFGKRALFGAAKVGLWEGVSASLAVKERKEGRGLSVKSWI